MDRHSPFPSGVSVVRGLFVSMSGFTLLLAGCGMGATPMGEKKETSGKVSLNGKALPDVKVVLQPTGDGAEAYAVTDKTGAFKTKATPGKYAWYLAGKDSSKGAESLLKSVPEAFKTGSMDRTVQVGSGDLNLEVK
jgi:hypothetical protein